MSFEKFQMDKTHFSVVNLHDQPDETAYWLTKTPEERFEALEYLRRMNYGDAACEGFQRV
ncbi:MAG: hypothetical protein HQM08_15745 [Candidatus Riflebacteria bacterium]|nr:hypothetical protein [Candidatus Riflebacteria bacterium]